MPIGEEAAADLRSALQKVPNERSGGEAIIIVRRPTKLVNQRTEDQSAVNHAAGEHDVGAHRQSLGDRKRADIGVQRRVGSAVRRRLL